jgi:hypothetical protein
VDDGDAIVSWERGVSRADLRHFLAETRDRHTALLAAWRMIHG